MRRNDAGRTPCLRSDVRRRWHIAPRRPSLASPFPSLSTLPRSHHGGPDTQRRVSGRRLFRKQFPLRDLRKHRIGSTATTAAGTSAERACVRAYVYAHALGSLPFHRASSAVPEDALIMSRTRQIRRPVLRRKQSTERRRGRSTEERGLDAFFAEMPRRIGGAARRPNQPPWRDHALWEMKLAYP